ncbi:MAG: hypothetical protein IJ815_02210, partial [Lachnospiraceae bacterium]|nr:hypothetical protein [Lachnospiraceae bacterium]
MKRKYARGVAVLSAAALTCGSVLGSVPCVAPLTVQAAENVDTTRLRVFSSTAINDIDGDGLNEFEGFGTSLCWWANRVGYSSKLTDETKRAFFGDDGLRMN